VSRIAMIPDRTSGNVYNVLLYHALEKIGIAYEPTPFSLRYLLRHAPGVSFHYLHFHWPEIFFVIRPRQPHKLFGLKGYLHLHAFWWLARRRGYQLVWTVHEVDVHDADKHTFFHAASRRLLWKWSALVFTHTADVRAEAERRWGPRPHVHTIPVGSYDGAYPATLSRQQARQRLGIPDGAYVFVFFGNIRPYKGIDILLAAFRSLQSQHPEAHLLLAGRPFSETYAREVRESCRDLPRVHLTLQHVPDEEIQLYLRSADCFVAPYKYIETCSAIYLALAFDLPVIIKSEGNVVEFATHPIGFFMRSADETETAMRHMLQMSPEQRARLRAGAREASRLHSWVNLAGQYRQAFAAFESERGADRTRGSQTPSRSKQPASR